MMDILKAEALSDVKIGDIINFERLDEPYVVYCQSENYILCKDVDESKNFYTIIDVRNEQRGAHNSFGYGCTTKKDCRETLNALESGVIEMSHRNILALDVISIKSNPPSPLKILH